MAPTPAWWQARAISNDCSRVSVRTAATNPESTMLCSILSFFNMVGQSDDGSMMGDGHKRVSLVTGHCYRLPVSRGTVDCRYQRESLPAPASTDYRRAVLPYGLGKILEHSTMSLAIDRHRIGRAIGYFSCCRKRVRGSVTESPGGYIVSVENGSPLCAGDLETPLESREDGRGGFNHAESAVLESKRGSDRILAFNIVMKETARIG